MMPSDTLKLLQEMNEARATIQNLKARIELDQREKRQIQLRYDRLRLEVQNLKDQIVALHAYKLAHEQAQQFQKEQDQNRWNVVKRLANDTQQEIDLLRDYNKKLKALLMALLAAKHIDNAQLENARLHQEIEELQAEIHGLRVLLGARDE